MSSQTSQTVITSFGPKVASTPEIPLIRKTQSSSNFLGAAHKRCIQAAEGGSLVRTVTTASHPTERSQTRLPSGSSASLEKHSKVSHHEILYKPSKPWMWACTATLTGTQRWSAIAKTKQYSMHISTGKIGDRDVTFVEKTWSTSSSLDKAFFSELALYKTQLRKLQGNLIPSIMGVFASHRGITVAMEVPHRVFWIEASKDIPKVLKKRCIDALQKLHDHGVCCHNLTLSKIWIGADAKVWFTGLHDGRSIEPNPDVFLRPARQTDMEMQMQKLKVLLDYEGALSTERKRFVAGAAMFKCSSNPTFPREDWFNNNQCDPRLFINTQVDMSTLRDSIANFHRIIDGLSQEGPVSQCDEPVINKEDSPPPPSIMSMSTMSALGKRRRPRSSSPKASPKRLRARSEAPTPTFEIESNNNAVSSGTRQAHFGERTLNSTDLSSRLYPTNVRDKGAQDVRRVAKRVQHLPRRENMYQEETEPTQLESRKWRACFDEDRGGRKEQIILLCGDDNPAGKRPMDPPLGIENFKHPSMMASSECMEQGTIDALLDSPFNQQAQRASSQSGFRGSQNLQSRRKSRQKVLHTLCSIRSPPTSPEIGSGLLAWVASWFGLT